MCSGGATRSGLVCSYACGVRKMVLKPSGLLLYGMIASGFRALRDFSVLGGVIMLGVAAVVFRGLPLLVGVTGLTGIATTGSERTVFTRFGNGGKEFSSLLNVARALLTGVNRLSLASGKGVGSWVLAPISSERAIQVICSF